MKKCILHKNQAVTLNLTQNKDFLALIIILPIAKNLETQQKHIFHDKIIKNLTVTEAKTTVNLNMKQKQEKLAAIEENMSMSMNP